MKYTARLIEITDHKNIDNIPDKKCRECARGYAHEINKLISKIERLEENISRQKKLIDEM